MNIELLKDFLLVSLVINYGILLIWFCAFAIARDFMFRLHSRWFKLAPQQFDAIHYGCMAAYKIGIILLNLVPLLALCWMTDVTLVGVL